MGGPQKTQTQSTPQLSPEAQRLTQIGADQTQAGLERAPITDFMSPNPRTVVGPNQATLDALAYFRNLAGGGERSGVMDAFNKMQTPLIQQQMGLAGLGRSGAVGQALAQGQAAAYMPALQMESGAATAQAGLGDYLRQIEDQKANAPYEDYLRRQGITESLLSGATGLIPSTIGQSGTSNTRTGGLIGQLFGGGSK